MNFSELLLFCSIGEVYREQAKFDEAMQNYERSLEISIRVVGHDHLVVAATKVREMEKADYDAMHKDFSESVDASSAPSPC